MNQTTQLAVAGVMIKSAGQLQQLLDMSKHLPTQHVDPSHIGMEALKLPLLGGPAAMQHQTGSTGSSIIESLLGGVAGGGAGYLAGGLAGKGKIIKGLLAALGGELGQAGGAYHAAMGSNERGNREAVDFLNKLRVVHPAPLLGALSKRMVAPVTKPAVKAPAISGKPSIQDNGFAGGGGGFDGGGAGGRW